MTSRAAGTAAGEARSGGNMKFVTHHSRVRFFVLCNSCAAATVVSEGAAVTCGVHRGGGGGGSGVYVMRKDRFG